MIEFSVHDERNLGRPDASKSISNLPEGIIHHIFSFLRSKQTIPASLLSKEWLSAWHTKPKLLFKESHFSTENLAKNTKKLVNYREQKIGIDSLKFDLEDWDSQEVSQDLVNNWMHVAVQNGVKSLKFYRSNMGHDQEAYVLPPIVFQATSLIYLDVMDCTLKLQDNEKIKCSNLKNVRLNNIVMDESAFEKILSSCKLIESFRLNLCGGRFKNLKVKNVQNLKRFELIVGYNLTVEVELSSLESFKWTKFDSRENGSRLTLHACPNLKIIKLFGIDITEDFFFNLDSKFPNLEDLSIYCCSLLQRLKISSHSLKWVDFHSNIGLVGVEFDIPNLLWFKIEGVIIQAITTGKFLLRNGQM